MVGTGMAAMATVEELLEHDAAEDWQITMVGREPDLPYNRMLLSKVVAGTAEESQLRLRGPSGSPDGGSRSGTGRSVRSLELGRRTAELSDGDELAFDRLVLATGSRPAVLPLPGRQRPGVHAFRTLRDARAIIRDAASARRAVVIGGGLLGLEVARGLRAHDLEVTVVHSGAMADGAPARPAARERFTGPSERTRSRSCSACRPSRSPARGP